MSFVPYVVCSLHRSPRLLSPISFVRFFSCEHSQRFYYTRYERFFSASGVISHRFMLIQATLTSNRARVQAFIHFENPEARRRRRGSPCTRLLRIEACQQKRLLGRDVSHHSFLARSFSATNPAKAILHREQNGQAWRARFGLARPGGPLPCKALNFYAASSFTCLIRIPIP